MDSQAATQSPPGRSPYPNPLPQRPALVLGVLPSHLPAERRSSQTSECGASLASDRSGPQLPLPDHAPVPSPAPGHASPRGCDFASFPPPFFGRTATLDPTHSYKLANKTSCSGRPCRPLLSSDWLARPPLKWALFPARVSRADGWVDGRAVGEGGQGVG